MKHAEHTSQLARLRRAEGQLKAVTRMIEDKRYCVDILTQLRAVRAAVRRVEEQILREHVEHCVAGALKGANRDEQREKIDELLDVLSRFPL